MGLKERRQREKENRKEQILRSARELLAQKGINGASMNQIANKAELGVATIYSYFESKEDLYLAIQEEGLEILYQQVLDTTRKQETPEKKLISIALAYLEFSSNQRNYFYIINYFISNPDILFTPTLKTRIDRSGEKILNVCRDVLQEGIDKAVFKPSDAKRLSLMYWGLLHGLTQFKKFQDTLLDNEIHMDFYLFSINQFIKSLY